MTEKASKLDKFIQAADKLVDSKGLTKLTKTLDKTLNIAGAAISAVADVTNHQLDEHHKRHLSDVKVPDIIGLTLPQTSDLFATLDLKHALLTPEPAARFASAKANTIIRTVPKANTILPAGGFVKIYYLDAETIAASQAIITKKVRRKQIRKEAAKGLAAKLGQGTVAGAGSVLKATAGVPKKLTRHPKKLKKTNATIIDAPAAAEEDDSPNRQSPE